MQSTRKQGFQKLCGTAGPIFGGADGGSILKGGSGFFCGDQETTTLALSYDEATSLGHQ